jgi:hypothetical protein
MKLSTSQLTDSVCAARESASIRSVGLSGGIIAGCSESADVKPTAGRTLCVSIGLIVEPLLTSSIQRLLRSFIRHSFVIESTD